ncbi:chorismate-binding protein [Kytococcus schroeteri]|uniref:chorismate-binding protein n=1 Tax=Kytococcus schroeteri TaxID=138300 RepID=UPI00192D3719|nr:chorismate-binding protein [Kytococcus schroeteri]
MTASLPPRPLHALLVDNHDSYTHVLAHLLTAALGREPLVLAHDDPGIRTAVRAVDCLVISPGPGHPARPEDVRLAAWALEHSGLPTLGVCLGHQLMVVATGGQVEPAPAPQHGLVDALEHHGTGLAAHLPPAPEVVRYHSLAAVEPLPAGWVVDARTPDGVVQLAHHTQRPWWGVQFHPESVGTPHGLAVVQAFADAVRAAAPRPWTLVARPVPGLERVGAEVVHARWAARVAGGAGTAPPAGSGPVPDPAGPSSWWLDSARTGEGGGRFTMLGTPTGPHAVVLRPSAAQDPFAVLEHALAARPTPHRQDLPFDLQGGFVGWLGYEARRWTDTRSDAPPVVPAATPEAVWMSADRYAVLDHATGDGWVVAHCPDEPAAVTAAEAWAASTQRALLGEGEPGADTGPGPDPLLLPRPAGTPLVADVEGSLLVDAATYAEHVETARRWLREGESYELCLTTAVDAPFTGEVLPTYLRQRRTNPAPFAALLQDGGTAVLCSSPERFLHVDAHGSVETRPIKGTAARSDDPAEDAARAAALATDPKTRAENLMVVDLLRNDLARVCRPGTVRVPRLMAVETHATVHQLVTTVTGRLREGAGVVDLLRAAFPGGSMTGAPKARSTDLLDQLEGRPRGIYAGTLGYLSATGTADLAIVIRTAVVHDGRVTVGAGGAVVLASDPRAEYEEMLTKARSACR